ncbi:type II secretion system minor pseudopilin GspI [Solimonas marina]|uniref:Type II secretion system protein I n=1 Tax=Solimonas marina TaxID=2714601 RepID=A0A970B9B0_9GAMM|nr:type II secretion system minor pseudopilin GspI [Solimonas marina]NKF23139.1 type II secretion system minor pseudopilin GspI [Solimonas marina]
MSARLRTRGFTLIEMLVAVAVVAIAMGAIIAGMGRYAANAAYLREKTVALWVAHNQLTELEMQKAWPDVGTTNGENDMAGVTWKWRVTIQKTQDEHLRRVDIVVAQPARDGKTPDPDKEPLVKLSSFLADSGRQ